MAVALVALAFVVRPAFFDPASQETPPRREPASPTALPTTPSPAPSTSLPSVDTAPATRLAIIGDTGMRDRNQRAMATRLAAESERGGDPYDALVILGDMIYPDGKASLTRASVNEPYAPVLKDATLIPTLGNHDVQSGQGAAIMRQLGRDSGWFVEKVGPVRVIALDSNKVGNPEQNRWLKQVLAEKQPKGTWTIAAMHHPAYSAGDHGSTRSVQQRWVPLFEQADVPLVLAGHDHDYQRSKELDGVTYVVSGGGAKLREAGRRDFTEVSLSVLHFLELVVYEDRIEGKAIDRDGGTIDQFAITR